MTVCSPGMSCRDIFIKLNVNTCIFKGLMFVRMNVEQFEGKQHLNVYNSENKDFFQYPINGSTLLRYCLITVKLSLIIICQKD